MKPSYAREIKERKWIESNEGGCKLIFGRPRGQPGWSSLHASGGAEAGEFHFLNRAGLLLAWMKSQAACMAGLSCHTPPAVLIAKE
jgi:hypothetical protein